MSSNVLRKIGITQASPSSDACFFKDALLDKIPNSTVITAPYERNIIP